MNNKISNFEIEKYLIEYDYLDLIDKIQKNHNLKLDCILLNKEGEDEISTTNFHSHELYEIIYIENGKCTYDVDGKLFDLEYGDFLLIPPFTLHKLIKIEKKSRRTLIIFNDNHLNIFKTEITDLRNIFFKVKETKNYVLKILPSFKHNLNSSMNMLEELFLSNEYGDDVLFNATFASLLTRINKGANFYTINNDLEFNFDKYSKDYNLIVSKIKKYIDNNIENKISLSDISKSLGLSESRLSHIYKDKVGISIKQYITKKRLSISKDMLKIGTPISEVLIKCGFQDYTSFLRAFKKEFNISPKAYQKQYMNE